MKIKEKKVAIKSNNKKKKKIESIIEGETRIRESIKMLKPWTAFKMKVVERVGE